jgi:hypothetical protein
MEGQVRTMRIPLYIRKPAASQTVLTREVSGRAVRGRSVFASYVEPSGRRVAE